MINDALWGGGWSGGRYGVDLLVAENVETRRLPGNRRPSDGLLAAPFQRPLFDRPGRAHPTQIAENQTKVGQDLHDSVAGGLGNSRMVDCWQFDGRNYKLWRMRYIFAMGGERGEEEERRWAKGLVWQTGRAWRGKAGFLRCPRASRIQAWCGGGELFPSTACLPARGVVLGIGRLSGFAQLQSHRPRGPP